MKKLSGFLCAVVLVFGLSGSANAALIDRGGGLIYDSNQNITWLQDANYAMTSGYDADGLMTWYQAVAWADQLVYGGYDDWRLPHTLPIDGSAYDYNFTYNGSTDYGYNISAPSSAYPGSTASEMAYMFYNNLDNLGYYATDGTYPQPGWGLINADKFINLQFFDYWSGTEYGGSPNKAWLFVFRNGGQDSGSTTNINSNYYAWAVRDGDVVPIPGAVWLLGSGLIGVIGIRRKFMDFERSKDVTV